MSRFQLGTVVFAIWIVGPTGAGAQSAAECPTTECAPAASSSPAHARLWQDAASIHQLKLAFVDALQRFVRAQAGTFGDEGAELTVALASMRDTLSRWDRAIQQFQTSTTRIVPDAEVHVARATVLLDRHRVEEALREISAAEALDDRRRDVYTLRALAYGASNRPEDAVRALRRAAALDPDNPTISYALAGQLSALKRADEGIAALRNVQRALDRRPPAVRQRAAPVAPFERVDLLRQASGVAPIFLQPRYTSGFAALGSGDYESAVARFSEAVPGDPLVSGPADAHARVATAAASLREGRVDEAVQQLRTALEANPDHAETHRLLGLVYWIDGQTGKSIEHLRSAIRLAADDGRARVGLSEVLSADRRLAEAERELTQAIEAGVRSGQIHYRLAQVYQQQSLLPQAAKAFQDSDAFGAVVGRDNFYQSWGSLLVNQADFEGAVSAYARRIVMNPNSAEAHRQLGEIYFLQGRQDEALAEFSVAVWLDPTDARAHAAAGQVHARTLKHADAIAALQRGLALDPTLREARYTLATTLMRVGKEAEGKKELETFSRQQAEADAQGQREFQLDALRRQGARDVLAGDFVHAIERFQEAASIDPGSARSHRDLGLALLRARRPLEAIAPLEAAQRLEETPEGFLYLVDAQTAVGNADEAGRQRALYRELVLRGKLARIRELGR